MTDSVEELSSYISQIVTPSFRDQLLNKGLARGLIWHEGMLPPEAPSFQRNLTEDLLDYAYAVLSLSLRLRSIDSESPILIEALLKAGEAIEAAIHRGPNSPDQGFHRVSAAISFHLARYSARAYSILPNVDNPDNMTPTEVTLVMLLRRNLDEMHKTFTSWLLNVDNEDEHIAERIRVDSDFDLDDASNVVVTSACMRGLALFDHALTSGDPESAALAIERLKEAATAAMDLHMVSYWWTTTLAFHLIDELWRLSLHQQISNLTDDDESKEQWDALRKSYIQRLRSEKRAAIELWPSQVDAVQRSVDLSDNLVVALPTSAGKTRIAELCILRTLATGRRVLYVTPLRALSSQVEHDLSDTFLPLGYSVSTLYGAAGIVAGDQDTLRDEKIVVSTPEKLDFALRNDDSIIDDIGLIVLDEGHMLGPNEREVRYEALVQRLLLRDDARERRLICLSALFPSPEEMSDIVAWLRIDEPGDLVHSTWRPTRQRFGVIRKMLNVARLDVEMGDESPYVPRFVEFKTAPVGSRRRNKFPNNKNELTLASAWSFVDRDMNVLIYCALRKSVETLGKLVLKCINQGVLNPLRNTNEKIRNVMSTGVEWLGEDHPAVQCLKYGVALHHGGLPRPFLKEVEYLLRTGECPLTIASPTLAQGLNLSASVLLVPSIWRNKQLIPAKEFANVAGRAGRAFVDLEGLVLHVVWETHQYRNRIAIQNWSELIEESKVPLIESGILQLSLNLCEVLAQIVDVPLDELVEYISGNEIPWTLDDYIEDELNIMTTEWERNVASLDSAILGLLDAETDYGHIDSEIMRVLNGSFFVRRLTKQVELVQQIVPGFITSRTKYIWRHSSIEQRWGYHAAGVGMTAGQFLDVNLSKLIDLLKKAEDAVIEKRIDEVADSIVEFAEIVFGVAPFRPEKELPENWDIALRLWVLGQPSSMVSVLCGNEGIDLLQDAFIYRLPWAMEAVRVHGSAVNHEGAEEITGQTSLVVEVGSSNPSVIQLLRNGLSSREAAITAVESTSAEFDNRAGMMEWLNTDLVKTHVEDDSWPTSSSRHSWLQFIDLIQNQDGKQMWFRSWQCASVTWITEKPNTGVKVVIEPSVSDDTDHLVLTPSFDLLGTLSEELRRSHSYIVCVDVDENTDGVNIEYFGPN